MNLRKEVKEEYEGLCLFLCGRSLGSGVFYGMLEESPMETWDGPYGNSAGLV